MARAAGLGFSRSFAGALVLAFALATIPDLATAAPGAFSDAASFMTALASGTTAIDFEALADGADVSGTTQLSMSAGVTLPGPVVDELDPSGPLLPLRVVADAGDNPASSGSRSLGVEDPKNFHAIAAGTDLVFTFPDPVQGFGLTIITPEEPGLALFDDDLELSVSGEATASLSLAGGQSLGMHGGREYRAYFLGVVGAAPFSTARLDAGPSAPTSGFLFNVDDLLLPVPEPTGAGALLTGAALLHGLRRRRDRRTEPRRLSRKGPLCR
jgi:hypothetical protein